MPTGQEAPWRGRRMTRTSWAKYLPPNWAPMPSLLGGFEQAVFQFDVAEGLAVLVAFGRQAVEVLGGGQLDGLHGGVGRGAADDEGDVVGRAGGGAEGLHLVDQVLEQLLRGEQRLGLLVEHASCWRCRPPWP